MRLVLDTSVGLKWLLREQDSDKAIRVHGAYRRKADKLIAPDVFCIESAHGLTRAERRGIIVAGEAQSLYADLLTTLPQLFPSVPLVPRALEISSQTRLGVYDCLYISLAEQEKCGLLTADQRIATIFANTVLLASLP